MAFSPRPLVMRFGMFGELFLELEGEVAGRADVGTDIFMHCSYMTIKFTEKKSDIYMAFT